MDLSVHGPLCFFSHFFVPPQKIHSSLFQKGFTPTVVESNVVVDHFPARNDLASALDGGSSLLSAGSDELAAWDENVNDSISLLSVSKPQNVNDSGSNSGANGSSMNGMSSMLDSQFTTFSDIASDGSVVKLTTVAVPPTNNNNNNNNNTAAAAAPGSLQPYTLHVYDRLVLQSRQRKESFRVKTQNEKEEALERRMPVSGASFPVRKYQRD